MEVLMASKEQKIITSPLKAIRARCLDCTGTAAAVRECTERIQGHPDGECVLRPYRFGKRPPGYATEAEAKGIVRPPIKAIRKYCLWCCLDSSKEVSLCPARECPLWAFRFGKKPRRSEEEADTGLGPPARIDSDAEKCLSGGVSGAFDGGKVV
jgi:hypothetical protein